MFQNKKKIKLWLVWFKCVGGDYLKKIYQKETEATQMKTQLEKTYLLVWIQKIIIKKKKFIKSWFLEILNKLKRG